MTVFDLQLCQYVEEHLSEDSNDVFQISRAKGVTGLQFQPIHVTDSPNLVNLGGYSLTGGEAPISF
jgi:hypothetical protein